MNPHICNACEQFAKDHPGSAEVELSLLFADVRGSTTLAENMGTAQFTKLIDRFYRTASEVLVESDALIDKIIGDQVAGIYVPGFVGSQHARRAVETGQKLLLATGDRRDTSPWIPLGVSVHTGIAYVGSVGTSENTIDITVLGDTANTAARIASQADTGEILVSQAAYTAAGLDLDLETTRELNLKGKSHTITVYVLSGEFLEQIPN